MEYRDEVFEEEDIELDGNTYVGCKFLRCRLTFAGTAGVSFDDCLFKQCNWNFQGSAATTLSFLSALVHGTRDGTDYSIFDALVTAIKEGHVVGGVTSPVHAELAMR